MNHSTMKAAIVTALFAGFGVVSFFRFDELNPYILGLYSLLLLHTFFSVRCFSALVDPRDWRQICMDVALVITYAFLGLSLGELVIFWAAWLILFMLATFKYIFLIDRLSHPRLLRRKLTADLLVVSFTAFFLLIPYSSMDEGAFTFLFFAMGSAWYLLLRPLYVPDHPV